MYGRARSASIPPTVPVRATLILAAAAVAAAFVLWPRAPELGASDAAREAARWVGTGFIQAPRGDGDEWEVDVARPDGSLVEVTVGTRGELLGFDEERGPGGGPAPDELRGLARVHAVRAALAATGPGRVLGAERERGGHIEVRLRRADGAYVEVGLDRRLRIREIEAEDPGDE
jgi:hypothetical protein